VYVCEYVLCVCVCMYAQRVDSNTALREQSSFSIPPNSRCVCKWTRYTKRLVYAFVWLFLVGYISDKTASLSGRRCVCVCVCAVVCVLLCVYGFMCVYKVCVVCVCG